MVGMEDDIYKRFEESRFYPYFHALLKEKEKIEEAGGSFLFFQTPLRQNIKGLSEFEKKRLMAWEFDFNHISEADCAIIREIYPREMDVEYLKQVYDGSHVYELNGIKYLADFQSKYVNVIDGKRVTYYQPSEYGNRIYIYGQCTARGTGVEDKHTIESFLQKMVNEDYPNSYQIVNMAVGCGSDLHDDIVHMQATDIKAGDIVILCTNLEIVPVYLFEEYQIPYFDCSELFHRPHSYGEWFTDSTFHTNARGNHVIAAFMKRTLTERKLLNYKKHRINEKMEETAGEPDCIVPDEEELNEYLSRLEKYKKEDSLNGCIVMNCNPFTEGHKFLIERASREVDNLYIFVVEENKSFFPFEDRLALVKLGTAHLDNVTVLPSGKFIISAVTFPGYFLKDGNKEISVNPSMDVRIFGKYIAKALNIKIRFAGEEPNDFVTRKYNESMRSILPKYGMEFVEIKRKEREGKIISASLVRKYLKEKDFEKIKKIVPKTTYDYLKEKYD